MAKRERQRAAVAPLDSQCVVMAYVVAGYAALLALWWSYLAAIDGGEVSTSTIAVVFGRCPAPYTMIGRECQLRLETSPSHLVLQASMFLVVAIVILVFARSRSFTGVFVVVVFGGVAIGWWPVGVPLLIFATVLAIKSVRLIRISK